MKRRQGLGSALHDLNVLIFEKNKKDPLLKEYARLLFDLALISEGSKLDDPASFSKTIGTIMAEAITAEELIAGDAIEV